MRVPTPEGNVVPTEERGRIGQPAVPRVATGIALSTWLWLIASGLGFWLAVARGVIWLV